MGDVQGFVAAKGLHPAAWVSAELTEGPSQKSVLCGAHAAALAEKLSMRLQALRTTKNLSAARLHLFLAAPNGFSFELGRHAAAIGPLTLYEFDFERTRGGGYTASLSLPYPNALRVVSHPLTATRGLLSVNRARSPRTSANVRCRLPPSFVRPSLTVRPQSEAVIHRSCIWSEKIHRRSSSAMSASDPKPAMVASYRDGGGLLYSPTPPGGVAVTPIRHCYQPLHPGQPQSRVASPLMRLTQFNTPSVKHSDGIRLSRSFLTTAPEAAASVLEVSPVADDNYLDWRVASRRNVTRSDVVVSSGT